MWLTCRVASSKDVLEGIEEAILWQWRDDGVLTHHPVHDVGLEHRAALPCLVLAVQCQVQGGEVDLPQALAARSAPSRALQRSQWCCAPFSVRMVLCTLFCAKIEDQLANGSSGLRGRHCWSWTLPPLCFPTGQ